MGGTSRGVQLRVSLLRRSWREELARDMAGGELEGRGEGATRTQPAGSRRAAGRFGQGHSLVAQYDRAVELRTSS